MAEISLLVIHVMPTLDVRGFLREEPWNGDKRSGEETENREDVRIDLN